MLATKHFLITLVASLVVYQQTANAFDVTDCSGGKASAKLLSLNVDTCPDQSVDRCSFIRGQNATMLMKFQPSK